MTGTYLLVGLGDERYALPVADVVEVGGVADPAQFPGAPRGVIGLQNVRGEVVPLLELSSLVGASSASGADTMVVVDDGGRRAALVVDAVLDVAQLEGGDAQTEEPPLRSSVLFEETLVGVLDTAALLDEVQGVSGERRAG